MSAALHCRSTGIYTHSKEDVLFLKKKKGKSPNNTPVVEMATLRKDA